MARSAAARAWRIRVRGSSASSSLDSHREVWTYSVPGAVAVHSKKEDKVSTFKQFWDDHANCKSRFFPYFVPAKNSLATNWGSTNRAKTIDNLLWPLFKSGRAATLSTVQEVFAKLGVPLDHAFVPGDHLHMTPAATKRITRAYFEEIKEDQLARGTTDTHVPIVIWDFNASTQSIKDDWDTHQSFWAHLAAWATAEGEEKRTASAVLSKALETAVLPGPEYYEWREGYNVRDPVDDTSDLEIDDPWCPGMLASKVGIQGVIVGSRAVARRAAAKGVWPSNDLAKFWRPTIMERLRAVGTRGVTRQAVDLLCAAADGDHQALFHAMQALSGGTEAPAHWYAIAVRRAKEPTDDDKGNEGV